MSSFNQAFSEPEYFSVEISAISVSFEGTVIASFESISLSQSNSKQNKMVRLFEETAYVYNRHDCKSHNV